ncbi:ABC transporter ATP-binding protein [Glaciibacter superstes]|uniref:ABC transporter ATP-binding protein n=1 Tax=Glaciibacter superstes TaxID=501023 RepID=UPI0004090E17|nr:ABC transporter ATP-binding protein [Glaciibacter superstes]
MTRPLNGGVTAGRPQSAAPGATTVEMRGISKWYSNGVMANDHVDLVLNPGEIHALVGENGAGKSTLMSILCGLEEPTDGEIRLDGQTVSFSSPVSASEAGIGMVHQEFKLFPSLTVAENVAFRAEPTRLGMFLSRREARERVRELADRYRLGVDPNAKVGQLSVGMLQRVEILKALHRDAQVLILDEPTAVLTPQEVDDLFAVLRELRDAGRTIVVVTHKLREVMAFSDRITVLRDGRSIATLTTSETNPAEVAHHMTGRDVDLDGRYNAGSPAGVALRVDGLFVQNELGVMVVSDANFSVRHGEIVGIAGVAGSGQTELIESIAGLGGHSSGVVELDGTDIHQLSAAERRRKGIAYIPEDRRGVGSAVTASVSDNLAMGFHRRAPLRKGWRLDRAAMKRHSADIIEAFGIRVSHAKVEAGTLSGGNLQKVIVGREMSHDSAVLLVDQPTRGVDIGAIENIHGRLRAYRDRGHAIVLTSAELSELFALADRILVMYGGRVVAEYPRADATEAKIGLAMAGITQQTLTGSEETT